MMNPIKPSYRSGIAIAMVTLSLLVPTPDSTVWAQTDVPTGVVAKTTSVDSPALQFNFSGADWPSVMAWFAEQAGLSLELDVVPGGSFSYTDPTRTYSVNESLDVLNRALLKRGYVAVRRGRSLQLIDLEVENADKLISEIAELVRADDLETRGNSDVVSCVFPLGSMAPDAAKEELQQLIGPWGRLVVLPSARQVKVTETAEKLISIRDVLRQTSEADTKVITVKLEHRGAEELLEIARPLLGIEPGQYSSDDLRLSIGPLGDRIYAIGQPVKTALMESFLLQADKPLGGEEAGADGVPVAVAELQTHAINTADTTTVFDVLQTMLADRPDTRISVEPNTNSIIAYGVPETHQLIQKTIAELERNTLTLKVFELKRLDPAQALLTINKYFGVGEDGTGRGPTVDGNPEDGKLWVRGTLDQIAAVERLIGELEGNDAGDLLGENVRFLRLNSSSMADAVQRAIQLWPITGRQNPIRTLPPSGAVSDDGMPAKRGIPEIRSRANEPANQLDRQSKPQPRLAPSDLEDASRGFWDSRFHTLVGDDFEPVATSSSEQEIRIPTSSGADIILQVTPAGLMIASEDAEALDEFEALLESMLADDIASDLPTIFQLKYAEAEPTAELISSILGGAESSLGSVVDSATGGMGGGMLGGLMAMAGGGGGGGEESSAKSVLTATGSVSIVPDARLNYLIVQAGVADLTLIEMLLEKIDVPESPVDVQLKPEPLLIPVIHQDAADIAKTVKEALGDRIVGQEKKESGGGGGGPNPREIMEAMRGGGRQATSEKTKSEAPKIGIAVDAKSNSLVVIASPQDFNEVRELVELLDEGGAAVEETVATISVGGNMNPDVMKAALEGLFGDKVTTKGESKGAGGASGSTAGGTASSGSTSSDDERRAAFFRSLRERGGFGGGTPGGGSSRGGGGPGGSSRGGGGGRSSRGGGR